MKRAFAAAVVLLACGQTFPPASLVTGLRVLGVRTDPPELRPGQSTVVTPLVVDPKGGGRPITITWARCVPPGLVNDLLTCQNPENLTPLGVGPTIPYVAPDFGTGPPDHHFVFLLLLVRAGSDSVVAFKEIRVSTGTAPLNQNPRLVGFGPAAQDGGVPTAVAPGTVVAMRGDFDPTSRESYVDDDGKTQTEEMELSFFATAGSWDTNRTFDEPRNTWTAPTEPQTVTMWVVLRDGRNGTDWRSITLEVR